MSILSNDRDASTEPIDIVGELITKPVTEEIELDNSTNENFDLRQFWVLEFYDVHDNDENTNPMLDCYEQQIKRAPHGRYIAPLPWNDKKPKLQPN